MSFVAAAVVVIAPGVVVVVVVVIVVASVLLSLSTAATTMTATGLVSAKNERITTNDSKITIAAAVHSFTSSTKHQQLQRTSKQLKR